MTGSPPHKAKPGKNDDGSRNDFMEGTSARTRPFSFDDIMRARKKKGDATKHVISGPVVNDKFSKDEKAPSPYSKQGDEDYGLIDNRSTSKDSQKLISWGRVVTDASNEDDRLVQDKYKGSREPYPKLMSVLDKNISRYPVVEGKNERFYHRDSKKDDILSNSSDNRTHKKQARGSAVKEKVLERSRRKSEIERKELHHEDRWVSGKRKPDSRISSDSENEYRKRNSREVKVDKLTDRGRDKSEKENRQKHHNEEDGTRGRSSGTKNDSGKKNLELSHAHLEESRSKRRRSRSRERAKDRGGRSRSHSPKVHKHTSKEKRDHEDLLGQSVMDKSGKEHSNGDWRISSNGSSKQYKQNTVSSSGLGGYSPRKRKTDAAAKTPSLTHRSPERRTAGWDLQPVEKEILVSGSTLFGMHATSQNLLLNLKQYPSGTTMSPIMVNQIGISPHTFSTQIHAVESIQLTQATRPMRRLYVENLPASATEKDLIDCINKFLLSSGINYIQGSGPCISCIIHKDKCQALLEFLTPEDASAALSFDGLPFSGSNLKLRRPKDYDTVSTTGIPDKSIAVDSTSSNVEDSPHKIFIGGISKLISSRMLLEIARAFGTVKGFHFEYIDDINEHCAFLEFVDHSVTSRACAGLNGIKLGGKVLTAVIATPDTVAENVRSLPFYGIPKHANPLLENPTVVLKLKNVFDHEGLLSLSESELKEIMEDIRFECSRFGTVRSVNVVKPKNSPDAVQAFELKTTSASIGGGCNFEKQTYVVDQLGENADESVQNEVASNCRTLENNNDYDNSAHLSSVTLEPEDINHHKMIGDTSTDKISVDDLAEDGIQKPPLCDGDVSVVDPSSQQKTSSFGESASQDNSAVNVLKINDNAASPAIGMGDKSCSDRDLKVEGNGNAHSSVEGKALDAALREDKANDTSIDLGDIFEPGSIFVEFRRSEGACMAAHCLHGRLFDGRNVSVGYISHDVHRMRFCK